MYPLVVSYVVPSHYVANRAGVEARGGSSVNLSTCTVRGCGKSGVFVHSFSRAQLTRCHIDGNQFAGVEAMRYLRANSLGSEQPGCERRGDEVCVSPYCLA